ncbi:hypothetical protein NQZ68_002634 [Dissostichus eleginoides]|nr:hypothetical protein NQZ68_002634 [Dissostichus eleginoides]
MILSGEDLLSGATGQPFVRSYANETNTSGGSEPPTLKPHGLLGTLRHFANPPDPGSDPNNTHSSLTVEACRTWLPVSECTGSREKLSQNFSRLSPNVTAVIVVALALKQFDVIPPVDNPDHVDKTERELHLRSHSGAVHTMTLRGGKLA